jgi:methionine synthase II (cobalamin-independent)
LFWGSFFPGLAGFEEIKEPEPGLFRIYAPDVAAFFETGHKPPESAIFTGKIKHARSTYVAQFRFLASLVSPEEAKSVKLTIAAPNWYHLRHKEGSAYPKDIYASDEEYFADIATAYQEELKILYEAGCGNVQFDDPNLASDYNSEKASVPRLLNREIIEFSVDRFLLRKDAGWMESRSIEYSIRR